MTKTCTCRATGQRKCKMFCRERTDYAPSGTVKSPWFIRIPLFIGQINIKPASDTRFSERYGFVPTCVIFGVRFTWRRWRY